MAKQHIYSPKYNNSWALIIGINKYQHVSQLHYARNDAESMAQILIEDFGFPAENVTVLTDEDATRSKIMEAYLKFAQNETEPDDKILFYFAGHGVTVSGIHGDVGQLVPVDGNMDNLASLIRWDEITRNAELISAKHIFFIMDACYGGLALNRSPSSGSMRFLKDMLQRNVRQVLTAGKEDEPVLDLGGPIPNHSVFTGHLLQGLQGRAAATDGIITANRVMSYVYEKVSKDSGARQTPHFGFLDGDGDFIFRAELLNTIANEPEKNKDILIEIPSTTEGLGFLNPKNDLATTIKEYISDERYKIRLDDLAMQQIRNVKSSTSDEQFPVQNETVTDEKFIDRLKQYESITSDLRLTITLLSHWGGAEHISTMKKILARMSEWPRHQSGSVLWLNLRWYPTTLLLYSSGIAAIAAENYSNLYSLFMTKSGMTSNYDNPQEVIIDNIDAMLELTRSNAFKRLPGHEKNYVPSSLSEK